MVIPAGYAQANIVFEGAAVPTGAEMTIGLNVGTFGQPASVAAAGVFDAMDTANMNTLWTSVLQVSEVRVKYGPDETGPTGIHTAVLTGTLATTGAAPMVSVLVQKVTALGGRAGRGRCYMPGVIDGLVDASGGLDTGYQAAAQTSWDDFLAELIATDLEPVVLHGAGSPISLPTTITSFAVANQVASQRRRNRR